MSGEVRQTAADQREDARVEIAEYLIKQSVVCHLPSLSPGRSGPASRRAAPCVNSRCLLPCPSSTAERARGLLWREGSGRSGLTHQAKPVRRLTGVVPSTSLNFFSGTCQGRVAAEAVAGGAAAPQWVSSMDLRDV